MRICKKYPKIFKLNTACPTEVAFDFVINGLSLNKGKSIILKGMKRKQQKDASLAHQSHFVWRNLNQSNNYD